MEHQWSDKFPIEVGIYWFYGWERNYYKTERSPQMYLTEVTSRTDITGKVTFTGTSGVSFLLETLCVGYWMKAEYPKPPDINRL